MPSSNMTRVRGREQFVLYKNNSDGKGNSYGYHENYLLSRAVPFERIAQVLTPFFVTRLIFAGAGKVGAENQTSPTEYPDFAAGRLFRVSRRSQHDGQAPDHQHARRAACRFGKISPTPCHRRRCEYGGTFDLSEGGNVSDIVLDLLEAGADLPQIELDDPVRGIKQVSRDLDVKETLKLAGGRPTDGRLQSNGRI